MSNTPKNDTLHIGTTTGRCVASCRRVTHTIELREKEEELRKRNLQLERNQTHSTIAACDMARESASDAEARLWSTGQSNPEAISRLVNYAGTNTRILTCAEIYRLDIHPDAAPFHVIKLLPGFYISTRHINTDSDADRVWRSLQSRHTDTQWDQLMRKCTVESMFDTFSPLQNLPGRVHLSCAILYAMLVGGNRSHRYSRMVPSLMRSAVSRVARMVQKATTLYDNEKSLHACERV